MKKVFLTLIISVMAIVASAVEPIWLTCDKCTPVSYTAMAPTGYGIVQKLDSLYRCASMSLAAPSLDAAKAHFDSLYFVMPFDSITNWPPY